MAASLKELLRRKIRATLSIMSERCTFPIDARRQKVRAIAVLAFGCVCWLVTIVPSLALPAESLIGRRTNIVFIITDDQGYGDMSCHGHPTLKTPHRWHPGGRVGSRKRDSLPGPSVCCRCPRPGAGLPGGAPSVRWSWGQGRTEGTTGERPTAPTVQ